MKKRVFFYCVPQGTPEAAAYQHETICLAEGLKELDIPFFSNVNYWRLSPIKEEYLLRHNPEIAPDDCSVVIVGSTYFDYSGKRLPQNLFHRNRKYITVYIDRSDGIRTSAWNAEFRKFDFILRTHYNSNFKYPSNIHPWFFGLSNRILKETAAIPEFETREKCLLVNFRVKHPLRDFIRETFLSSIQAHLPLNDSFDSFNAQSLDDYHYLQWAQSGRRHYPSYYKRLKESVSCACFGGYFVPFFPGDPASYFGSAVRKVLRDELLTKLDPRLSRIGQWDSWRFWESLAAGCVTFHLDFQQNGFLLPEMPENWKHYVGIDLRNIDETVERIIEEPEVFKKISTQGRHWANNNYSPKATASSFLKILGEAVKAPSRNTM